MLEKRINRFFPYIIICFLISDFLTSVSYKLLHSNFYRYSGLIKLVVGIVMLFLIITHLKKTTTLKVLGLIIIVFIIGQFFSEGSFDLKEQFLKGNIYFFLRYIYILLFIIIFKFFNIKKVVLIKTNLFFEYFLWINSFFIILGLLFNLEIFRSFEHTERFGYSGLFSNPGEASYFYMLGIILNYYKWHTQRINRYKIKVFLLIILASLLGQKKIFLFLFLFFMVILLFKKKYKKYIIIAFPIIVAIVYFFRDKIIAIISTTSPYWGNHIHKYGFLTAATSFRNVSLDKTIIHIKNNWTYINYLFGGVKLEIFKTEFGFFDIIFFFGFFGTIYYVYIYNIFIKNKGFFLQSLITTLFITSFFSGGLLLYPTVMIVFYGIVNTMDPLPK